MCRFLKQNAWFWVFFILLLLHTIFRLLGCFFLGTKGSCKIDYFLWSIWTRKIQVCTFPIFNLSLDCHKKYSIALNEFIFLGNEWWKMLSFLLNFRHFLHYPGKADHLTCLLRNLYAGQEATVRTSHGTTDWFKTGKGVQGYILSPFNLYAEYIMRNAGLDEAQAGIKIARWSTSWNQDCQEKYQLPQKCKWHHPYGRKRRTKEPLDESERGAWKNWPKINIQKTKIMASGPITS